MTPSVHTLPEGERHLLVGRVGLGVGLLATLVLLALIATLGHIDGSGYSRVLRSLAVSREGLLPALAVSAALLIAFAGVLTWMVARYVTFRVAGPLYRFARNLEVARTGNGEILPIRGGDLLQAESRRLLEAIGAVAEYEEALRGAARDAREAVEPGSGLDEEAVRERLAALRDVVNRAGL